MAIDYKKAGVDIETGDRLVDWLKANPAKTNVNNPNIVSGVGGFASLFRADFSDMEKPCLVSCTDGVGTKIKLATHFESYKEVAQDLVAMCVNDLICCGAKPLFFLDYYSCGKLELEKAKDFLSGVKTACELSECALIGGETAEMPGVYQQGDFDCAGFSVGVVDQNKAKGSHLVQSDDILIALPSSGFHSNGFSLIRKLFADDLDQHKEALLTPTALYVKPIMKLLASEFSENVHAMAHITGGGIDNILRVVPNGSRVEVNSWDIPPYFMEVKKRSELPYSELLKTLNCGLGFVLAVSASTGKELIQWFSQMDIQAFKLGQITSTSEQDSQIQLPEEWVGQ